MFLFNEIIFILIVMTLTLTFNSNTSVLNSEYFPPLELSTDYECGLIDLHTYNTIPNVDVYNNKFHIGDDIIEIPIGSYEIDDIDDYLQKVFEEKPISKVNVNIWPNNNTLQVMIQSNSKIYFDKEASIGQLLGFSKRQLSPNIIHTSDLPVNIIKVNAIRVECNIISGCYINNQLVHTIHEFSPMVPPGYKIVEIPRNVIYFPLNTKRLTTVNLKLVDQDGDLVNFRNENITIRLHLRPR